MAEFGPDYPYMDEFEYIDDGYVSHHHNEDDEQEEKDEKEQDE